MYVQDGTKRLYIACSLHDILYSIIAAQLTIVYKVWPVITRNVYAHVAEVNFSAICGILCIFLLYSSYSCMCTVMHMYKTDHT